MRKVRMTQESLWDFALNVYGKKGVEVFCLKLQDEYALSINKLLWGLWLDQQSIPYHPVLWAEAEESLRGLEFRIRWVRRIRRTMPKVVGFIWFRNQVKQWELNLEKKELLWLEKHTHDFVQQRHGLVSAVKSEEGYLECYLKVIEEHQELRETLSQLQKE